MHALLDMEISAARQAAWRIMGLSRSQQAPRAHGMFVPYSTFMFQYMLGEVMEIPKRSDLGTYSSKSCPPAKQQHQRGYQGDDDE